MDISTKADTTRIPLEWKQTLITRGGVVMTVRPVLPTDEPVLEALFARVSPEDLRHRFLTSMRCVDHARLLDMVVVDYRERITFIAFDGQGDPIASAMLAADAEGNGAEVAISVRSDLKGKGIGWTLLDYVCRYARDEGFRTLHSVESPSNRATIDLEREAGFHLEACEGDPADVNVVRSLATS